MRLYLKNHSYKYAAEQIMLVLFPQERPEYAETPAPADCSCGADMSLHFGKQYATAHTRLYVDGSGFDGYARIRAGELTDKLVTDRLLQKILKLSFFRANMRRGGEMPVWGALTGIRPGKLLTNMLESGMTELQAEKAMCRTYYVSPERSRFCVHTAKASMQVQQALEKKDICLYVGIPFCPTRCAYCSFVSNSVEKSMHLVEPYLEALYKEIDATAALVKEMGLRIISVYMGGGTPTTLSAGQMAALMRRLEEQFNLSAVREYTVEAGRPDTITKEKLEAIKNGGADRISINPQTMSDAVLTAIGRRHSVQQVVDAMHLAKEVGFGAINMDLIAGLPADTAEGFAASLDQVLALQPENVTVHTLSLKKGTRITLEGTAIPDREEVGKMLDYAAKKLTEGGFAPYYLYRQKFISGGFENIGWSKPGTESLYNICIMEELCTILALGGGGSTKLTAVETGRIERIFNAKYPYEYINSLEKTLAAKEEIRAFYESEKLI